MIIALRTSTSSVTWRLSRRENSLQVQAGTCMNKDQQTNAISSMRVLAVADCPELGLVNLPCSSSYSNTAAARTCVCVRARASVCVCCVLIIMDAHRNASPCSAV
eukprot:COSAG06_NODE_37029_length_440_cov_0.712610_1_plen_104_part_10